MSKETREVNKKKRKKNRQWHNHAFNYAQNDTVKHRKFVKYVRISKSDQKYHSWGKFSYILVGKKITQKQTNKIDVHAVMKKSYFLSSLNSDAVTDVLRTNFES
jgi:hypothetical protein